MYLAIGVTGAMNRDLAELGFAGVELFVGDSAIPFLQNIIK